MKLDLLHTEAVYRLFRECERKVTFGAFSAVRRTQLEDWNRSDRLRARFDDDHACTAALTYSVAERPRALSDFRGRTTAMLRKGDALVGRVAARGDGWLELCEMLHHLPVSGRTFVSIFQEHTDERDLVERLGLAPVGVKIRSTSEIVGMYATRSEPYRYSPLDVVGIAPIELAYDAAEMRAQVLALDVERWTNHYSFYNNRDSWAALALRGYGGTADFIVKPSEMTAQWRASHPEALDLACADTPLFDELPSCRALVNRIEAEPQRVRLMLLGPGGGELERHTDLSDIEHGTEDGQIMRLHFPILTNEHVRFESWDLDGERHATSMTPGCGWYLDVRKPHTARNDGIEPRVHLVVDVHANERVRELVMTDATGATSEADETARTRRHSST